jgi:hypothetical protein
MNMQDVLLAVLLVLVLALYAAVGTVLARRYLRGRDVGFVWLGLAGVVWPLLSALLAFGQRFFIARVLRREAVVFPFSLVERGQLTIGGLDAGLALARAIVGVALLLVAVFCLCRSTQHPAPGTAPST